jgi:hypothetical protein
MKNVIIFFSIFSFIFFTSCKNDDDIEVFNEIGQVFETTESFIYDPDTNTYRSRIITYPFNVFESDVILVYRLDSVININNGETADVWSQLPQSVFFNDGTGDIFQYNFNQTFLDLELTIEGNFDLTQIGNNNILNQTFRIVALPAEFADTKPSMEDILSLQ